MLLCRIQIPNPGMCAKYLYEQQISSHIEISVCHVGCWLLRLLVIASPRRPLRSPDCSQSPSSACTSLPRLFHSPDCFTVSTLCTYTDLGSIRVFQHLTSLLHFCFTCRIIWYLEPSVLTCFSLTGLILCLIDFTVPTITSYFFSSVEW